MILEPVFRECDLTFHFHVPTPIRCWCVTNCIQPGGSHSAKPVDNTELWTGSYGPIWAPITKVDSRGATPPLTEGSHTRGKWLIVRQVWRCVANDGRGGGWMQNSFFARGSWIWCQWRRYHSQEGSENCYQNSIGMKKKQEITGNKRWMKFS